MDAAAVLARMARVARRRQEERDYVRLRQTPELAARGDKAEAGAAGVRWEAAGRDRIHHRPRDAEEERERGVGGGE